MRQHRGGKRDAVTLWTAFITWLKELYLRLFPYTGEKPAFAAWCYERLRIWASRPHRKRQDKWFPQVRERLVSTKRVMVFLVPAIDVVNGGFMSICNIAKRSQEMKDLHGYEVVMATLPGKVTISGFSRFENDRQIFRFEQIEDVLPEIKDIFIQIEGGIVQLTDYLRDHGQALLEVPNRRLNILDQNIEVMPSPEEVQALCNYFGIATQTCAHERYCTQKIREEYGLPMHLLPADIPTKFYQIPYREKENLFAYSIDENPHKETVLHQLGELLPDYRFIMIKNMTFDEYKQTISRAKWTLTFGEGWDGYFIQPYFSNSIGFCVFNEAFCPERMRAAPTVFQSYETLAEDIVHFIHEHDNEIAYTETISTVMQILFPPPPPDAVTYDALAEYYRGNYTIP